jgi:hypothetical protein
VLADDREEIAQKLALLGAEQLGVVADGCRPGACQLDRADPGVPAGGLAQRLALAIL